jgi:phage portal protein BeeE
MPDMSKYESTLQTSLDPAEKRIRQWLDDLFPMDEFGRIGEQFRDATAVRMVRDVREIDASRIN